MTVMNRIVAFIAFCCFASPASGRRSNANLEAPLGLSSSFELSEEIAKAEATVEVVVENVDEGLNAAPKAEAQTWATVSTVDQVGPSLDDIVPKTAVNYVITEGAAPSVHRTQKASTGWKPICLPSMEPAVTPSNRRSLAAGSRFSHWSCEDFPDVLAVLLA